MLAGDGGSIPSTGAFLLVRSVVILSRAVYPGCVRIPSPYRVVSLFDDDLLLCLEKLMLRLSRRN